MEESDALPPEFCNHFDYNGKEYTCQLLCDLMHLEGAESLAEYKEDFYAGMPVITEHAVGKGKAYYVGTRSNAEFYSEFIGNLCEEKQIKPEAQVPDGIEAVIRKTGEHDFLFLLNHSEEAKEVRIPDDCLEVITDKEYKKGDSITLTSKDVAILQM